LPDQQRDIAFDGCSGRQRIPHLTCSAAKKLFMKLGQFARHHYGPARAEDSFNILERLENTMWRFIEHKGGGLIPERFECARSLAGFRRQKPCEEKRIGGE